MDRRGSALTLDSAHHAQAVEDMDRPLTTTIKSPKAKNETQTVMAAAENVS
jgi:hypothetical protein